MEEEWRAVVGWEGSYEVSNLGSVRTVTREVIRSDGVVQTRKARTLKPTVMNSGHLRVGFSESAKTWAYLVHRLVCEAFHGPAPEGKPLALHWDDNPGNNKATNIYWGDYVDNRRDLYRNRPPRNANKEKTYCSRSHEFTEDNTYWYEGRRQCRECRKYHDLKRGQNE